MKSKTRHPRAIALIIAFQGISLDASSVTLAQAAPPPAEQRIWYGELDAGERLFRFVIRARKTEEGAWAAELESIDEGRSKFLLTNFSLTRDSLAFETKASKATYQGIINPESQEVVGQWTQAGTELELRFASVDQVPENCPSEVWTGPINMFLQKLDVQVRVYQSSNGEKTVFFDSVSQNAGGFKATLTIEQNRVTIDVPMIGGSFKGAINESGDRIVGKWSQGLSLDLTLTKLELPIESNPAEPPARPQTPQAPFPYLVEPVQFENHQASVVLRGTITIPNSLQEGVRFSVAVLISGSGPQDRDQTIFGHKPFLVIADHLTRHGIAVLRFDERGVGESTGDFESATTADFAEDVRCAVEYLKKRPDIDPTQIGLIGHSEGGIVAPIVAATSNDVAWIVMLAGTGVNGREISFSQSRLIAAAEGATDTMLARQQIMLEVVFEWLPKMEVGKIDQKEIEQIVSDVTRQILRQETAAPLGELEPIDSETSQKQLTTEVQMLISRMNNPWFRYFASFEPGSALREVRCPVLALQGGRDLQVDPQLNLPKIVEHLKAAQNTQFRTIEFPELNHLFQTSQTGSPTEYEKIEETFSIVALEKMVQWIRGQVSN